LVVLLNCGSAVAIMNNIYEMRGEKSLNLEVLVVPSLWIMICVAGIAFILSFVGCWGAFRERSCLLNYYSTLLAIILVVQLAIIGISSYNKHNGFNVAEINEILKTTLDNYIKGNVTKNWDAVQTDVIIILSSFFHAILV
jgi:Tetraspanin family